MTDAVPRGSDAPEGARAPAMDAAAALLGQLSALGVAHLVVSPGSRSQALALVAAELEARGRVQVHVRIDERVAGFTALGIARETRMPVGVICTSGTAVANLLPAVLEAHHAGVPLLLLTADRPPELRAVGANQTTRQPGLFSPFVRFETDLAVPTALDTDGDGEPTRLIRHIAATAVAAGLGRGTGAALGPVAPAGDPASAGRPAPAGDLAPAGPVHLNLPYREPLAGAVPPWLGAEAAAPASTPPPPAPILLPRGPRTIVVAGADAGPAAEALAHDGGWPLVAEIVSGARFGRHLVHGYRGLLADPALGGRVERAVVFGHPTLSREIVALLSRADLDIVAVRGPGEALNLNGLTSTVDAVTVDAGEADRDWLGSWMRASHAASIDLSPAAPDADGLSSTAPERRLPAIAAELEVIRAPIDRVGLVDAVWRATWPHDRLMFASSRLVRVADAVLAGKRVPVHANRGLAGIDGTVATATGIAIASQAAGAPGVTRLLAGDLAFLHDVGALLLPPGEDEPRIQVIVGNDGGGTIFDGLEVAAVASGAAMDRVLYTPHTARLDHLAAAYGWEYQRVTTRAALDQALTASVGGRQIIDVPLAR